MLQRINQREQVINLYAELEAETNWYWWIEGAIPDYGKFEDWISACKEDPIGLFANIAVEFDPINAVGFSRFSRTDLIHGITYLTVWVKPSLRKKKGLVSHGAHSVFESLNFAFSYFPIRKVYFHIIKENRDSLDPIQRIAEIEGTMSDHYFMQGHYRDLLILSINRSNWGSIKERYEHFLARTSKTKKYITTQAK